MFKNFIFSLYKFISYGGVIINAQFLESLIESWFVLNHIIWFSHLQDGLRVELKIKIKSRMELFEVYCDFVM